MLIDPSRIRNVRGMGRGSTLIQRIAADGIDSVFIALEELGYLVMSLSFLLMGPVFLGKGWLESAVGWVFVIGCTIAFAALIVILFVYGLERLDRFEVVVISTAWLVLLINGILLSILFRRQPN